MRVAVDGQSSAGACCCYHERQEDSKEKPLCSNLFVKHIKGVRVVLSLGLAQGRGAGTGALA